MRFLRALTVALSFFVGASLPADAQLWLWSQTATTNSGIDPSINWQEGMPPSAVNDSSRAEMAIIAKWRDDHSGLAVTGGTATAYTLTTNSGTNGGLNSSLVNGYNTCFTLNLTNGTAPTLAIDGQAAKPIRNSPNVNVTNAQLFAGTPYCVTFFSTNGGEYILSSVYATGAVGTAQLIDHSVTYPKIQLVVGNNVVLGNVAGANSTVQELTGTQVNTFLPVFSSGLNGSVPASGGGSSNFLRADGTWAAPGGSGPGGTNGQVQWNNAGSLSGFTMSGDATLVTSTGVITIGNHAIQYIKIQNEGSQSLLGNPGGSSASPSEISLGAGLAFSASNLIIPTNGITTSMLTGGSVTYAKIQNESNATLLGNDSGISAAPSEITLGAGLSFLTSTSIGIGGGAITSGMLASNSVGTGAIISGAVTYGKIQNVTNARLLGNDSGSPAAPTEIALGLGLTFSNSTTLAISGIQPNFQAPGGSGTYTTPTSSGVLPLYLRVRMIGGGGGGGACATNSGGTGGTTTFGSTTAIGGTGGGPAEAQGAAGGTGGATGTGFAILRVTGGSGGAGLSTGGTTHTIGGMGGSGYMGGGGGGSSNSNTALNGQAGGGGGGAGCTTIPSGAGGGAGEYVEFIVQGPASSYSFSVGGGGSGGPAGSAAGGAGGTGLLLIEAYWE